VRSTQISELFKNICGKEFAPRLSVSSYGSTGNKGKGNLEVSGAVTVYLMKLLKAPPN